MAMTPEQRRENFWRIRNANLEAKQKAERKAAIRKKFQENVVYVIGGVAIVVIILFLFGIRVSMGSNNKKSIETSEAIIETSMEETTIAMKPNYPENVSVETAAETEPELPKVKYENVTFTKVNIRSEKSTDSEIIDTLDQNKMVGVINDEGEWIKVLTSDNKVGYIKSEYIGDELGYKKYNAIQEKVFTNVNVRTSPDKSSSDNVAFKLSEGKDVQVVGSVDEDWTEILYQDKSYFIASKYVGNEKEYKDYQASLDKTPYNDYLVSKWGFSKDLQKYTYDLCKEFYPSDPEHYYAFLLGTMQQESDLGKNRSHYNSNGTRDLGIMQVNSCNWADLKKKGLISSYDLNNLTCDELQYNDYICIRAGMDEMNVCVNKWGISQNAYYSYNTGRHKTQGTNKGSNLVWGYYKEWCKRLGI